MSGMININNYEAFFLDYLEGNLSGEEEEELFLFLDVHPELRETFAGYEELILSPENVTYPWKDKLKKVDFSFETIDKNNFEDACIAYWEGDLTTEERKRVENYLKQYPERERDFSVYGRLFLKPGYHSFSGKEKLYRKLRPAVFGIAYRISAVAAVVMVILVFVFWQKVLKNHTGETRQASIHQEMVAPAPEQPENNAPSIENTEEKTEAGKVALSVIRNEKQNKLQTTTRQKGKKPVSTLKSSGELITQKVSKPLAFCPVINQFEIQTSSRIPQLNISLHSEEEKGKEKYLTLGQYASLKIKKNVIKEDTARTPRLSPRDIMLLGVKGINMVTGINLQIEEKKDTSKRKEYFALTSNLFSYIRERKSGKK